MILIFLGSGNPCINSTDGSAVREDMALRKGFEMYETLDLADNEAKRDASITNCSDLIADLGLSSNNSFVKGIWFLTEPHQSKLKKFFYPSHPPVGTIRTVQ